MYKENIKTAVKIQVAWQAEKAADKQVADAVGGVVNGEEYGNSES